MLWTGAEMRTRFRMQMRARDRISVPPGFHDFPAPRTPRSEPDAAALKGRLTAAGEGEAIDRLERTDVTS
jgi:hypothetical protein